MARTNTLEHRAEATDYEDDPHVRMEKAAGDFFKDLETRDKGLSGEIRNINGLTRMNDEDSAAFRPDWKDKKDPVTDWERTAHFRNGHETAWMAHGDRDAAREISASFQKATESMDFDEARQASHQLTKTLMAPVSEQARILQDAPGFVREGPGGEMQRDPGLDAMMKPFQKDLEERTAWIEGTIERGLATKNDVQVQDGLEQMRLLQDDFKTIRDGGDDLHLHNQGLRTEYENHREERGNDLLERFHTFRTEHAPGIYEKGVPSCEDMLSELDWSKWDRKGEKENLKEHLELFAGENLPGDMKLLEKHIERQAASGGAAVENHWKGWGGDQEMTIWDLKAQERGEAKTLDHQDPAKEQTESPALQAGPAETGKAETGNAEAGNAEAGNAETGNAEAGKAAEPQPEKTVWDLRAEQAEREAMENQKALDAQTETLAADWLKDLPSGEWEKGIPDWKQERAVHGLLEKLDEENPELVSEIAQGSFNNAATPLEQRERDQALFRAAAGASQEAGDQDERDHTAGVVAMLITENARHEAESLRTNAPV